jgi:hypothetical protein
MVPTIGFDFDRCLVEAYTFTPFAILLEGLIPNTLKDPSVPSSVKLSLERSRLNFYNRVADYEIKTKGTIFRPSLLRLLPKLLELRQQGKIQTLFIYSNNGLIQLIHSVDYILGLILQKAPYNVKQEQLISEVDGLHVLSPRIHVDHPCRSSVEPEVSGFREKTMEGIQSCIGQSLLDSQLWYLDDTQQHTQLINRIKDHYIQVEPYSVYMSNRKLAELFIESFPIDSFMPNSSISNILLTEINKLMPGFRPTGRETRKTLSDKFVKVLNAFSPNGGGRVMSLWKEDHVNSDYKKLEQGLRDAIYPVAIEETASLVNQIAGAKKARRTRKLRKR